MMFNPPHPGGIWKVELDYVRACVSNFAKQIEVDPAYLKLVWMGRFRLRQNSQERFF